VSIDGQAPRPDDVVLYDYGAEVPELSADCAPQGDCVRTVRLRLERARTGARRDEVHARYELGRTEVRGLPVRIPNRAGVSVRMRRR